MNDKLKPFGISIHAAIDVFFPEKKLWLKAASSIRNSAFVVFSCLM
jgi:hypothetical protein